jgi:hypothetical protein
MRRDRPMQLNLLSKICIQNEAPRALDAEWIGPLGLDGSDPSGRPVRVCAKPDPDGSGPIRRLLLDRNGSIY